MRNSSGSVLALLTSSLLLAACTGSGEVEEAGRASDAATESGPTAVASEIERGTVIVGSTSFPEQEIVGQMYALVLEQAGYTVERSFGLGAREVVYPKIEAGEIDVMADYLNTLLLHVTEGAAEGTPSTEETAAQLEKELPDELTLLDPSPAQDTSALVVTRETADRLDLEAISDLRGKASDLVLGGPPECPQRPRCQPGYEDVYGLEFEDFAPLDVGGPLTTEALNSGEVDVGHVFTTQSAIATNDWVVLEDDRQLQVADNITPIVHRDVLNDEIPQLLDEVSAALTTQKLIELNERVDAEGQSPAQVARSFLEQEGVLDSGG
ncbi:MAG: ABC transporter substrate-binding protein [Actinobacteria bacterium]|nr:ABC transporter substrate-binding protein [Actinomycetota bacterium]